MGAQGGRRRRDHHKKAAARPRRVCAVGVHEQINDSFSPSPEADKAGSSVDDGIHEELPASAQNGRPGSEPAATPEVEVELFRRGRGPTTTPSPPRRPAAARLAMAEEAQRPAWSPSLSSPADGGGDTRRHPRPP
ncbi:hypothetical protein ZWY2020_033714 [Hordeum vulgare]|nr:hypothetical protein ZWY2020_033714 [Hordeum vulgare]